MSDTLTYENAIKQLKKLLEDHNAALPNKAARVQTQQIVKRIIEEGGTSLAGLRALERADLISFGMPRALATQAINTFSPVAAGTAAPVAGVGQAMVIRNEADVIRAMSSEALLDAFDPRTPGAVGDELHLRACGQAFLVYTGPGGAALDKAASAERLRLIVDNVPVTDHVVVDGEPIRPLRVGERPDSFLAENPLYPGRPLRQPGDVCDVTHESWHGISDEVKVLLHVAVRGGELRLSDAEIARSIVVTARGKNALPLFRQRYPRAAIELRETPAAQRPTLQIRRPVGGGTTPPFGEGPVLDWVPGKVRVVVLGPGEEGMVDQLTAHMGQLAHPTRGTCDVWKLTRAIDHTTGRELATRVSKANIAVLVAGPVTPSSVMEALVGVRDNNRVVVPVISRPFDVAGSPLAGLQALPRVLSSLSAARDVDTVLVDVVREIRGIADRIRGSLGRDGVRDRLAALSPLQLTGLMVNLNIEPLDLVAGPQADWQASAVDCLLRWAERYGRTADLDNALRGLRS